MVLPCNHSHLCHGEWHLSASRVAPHRALRWPRWAVSSGNQLPPGTAVPMPTSRAAAKPSVVVEGSSGRGGPAALAGAGERPARGGRASAAQPAATKRGAVADQPSGGPPAETPESEAAQATARGRQPRSAAAKRKRPPTTAASSGAAASSDAACSAAPAAAKRQRVKAKPAAKRQDRAG